ncbi:MAG: SPOR domain-containing protein [Gammaproteobacteria bacterium AqS3]|nr:SPOR domain-containing protein [Gammaproteobacteria bacterium AqS3]
MLRWALAGGFVVIILMSFSKTYEHFEAPHPEAVIDFDDNPDFMDGLKRPQFDTEQEVWVPTGYRYRLVLGARAYSSYDDADALRFKTLALGISQVDIERLPGGSWRVITGWYDTRSEIEALRTPLVENGVRYRWDTDLKPREENIQVGEQTAASEP